MALTRPCSITGRVVLEILDLVCKPYARPLGGRIDSKDLLGRAKTQQIVCHGIRKDAAVLDLLDQLPDFEIAVPRS